MPASSPPRRSARIQTRNIALTAALQAYQASDRLIHKPTAKTRERYISAWLEENSSSPTTTKKRKLSSKYTASSDPECSEENDDSELEELVDLRANESDCKATRGSRAGSWDSRCAPGNEDYEIDGFVVGDEEVTDTEETDEESKYEGSAGDGDNEESEKPKAKRRRLVRKIAVREWSPTSERSRSRQSSAHSNIPSISERLPSNASSKLFYTDSDDSLGSSRRSSSLILSMRSASSASTVVISDDPSEIAEQINDAISIFSRRFNRARPAIVLLLSLEVLQDYDVREALQDAVRLELASMVPGACGGEMWCIGPPRGKRGSSVS